MIPTWERRGILEECNGNEGKTFLSPFSPLFFPPVFFSFLLKLTLIPLNNGYHSGR